MYVHMYVTKVGHQLYIQK